MHLASHTGFISLISIVTHSRANCKRELRIFNSQIVLTNSGELPALTGRNVPIAEIARAMHKDAQYVRVGLQQGMFRFGYALKMDDSNEFNYYCPDRKVWEEIGYFQPEAS